GVQAELTTSVAAERKHADRLRRAGSLDEELLDERIHALRVLLERHASALAALSGWAQFPASCLEAGGSGRARVGRGHHRREIRLIHRARRVQSPEGNAARA